MAANSSALIGSTTRAEKNSTSPSISQAPIFDLPLYSSSDLNWPSMRSLSTSYLICCRSSMAATLSGSTAVKGAAAAPANPSARIQWRGILCTFPPDRFMARSQGLMTVEYQAGFAPRYRNKPAA
ncbi:MAG: hypothetical protein ACJ8D3_04415 [Sphingomicrobium sp.]